MGFSEFAKDPAKPQGMWLPGTAGCENAFPGAKPLLREGKIESGLEILYHGALSAQKEFDRNRRHDGQSRPIPKIVLSAPVSETLLNRDQSLALQLLKLAKPGGLPGCYSLSGAAHVCELGGGFQRWKPEVHSGWNLKRLKDLFAGVKLHFAEDAFQHMVLRQDSNGFKKHDPCNHPAAHSKAKLVLT